MSKSRKTIDLLNSLPNGSVVRYRNKLYCVIEGIEARILTEVDTGCWQFIRECVWGKVAVVFRPHPIKDN